MSYTIEFDAAGTDHTAKLSPIGNERFVPLLMARPEQFRDNNIPPNPTDFTEESIAWMIIVISEVSDLEADTIQNIPTTTMVKVFADCLNVANGGEPSALASDASDRDHPVFDDLDLDDQGAVDLEDMR